MTDAGDADDDEEVDAVEVPAVLPLRASGVKRLTGRFFRLPRPRFSSSSLSNSPAALDEDEDKNEDDEDDEVLRWLGGFGPRAASRALISSGEI